MRVKDEERYPPALLVGRGGDNMGCGLEPGVELSPDRVVKSASSTSRPVKGRLILDWAGAAAAAACEPGILLWRLDMVARRGADCRRLRVNGAR